MIDSLSTHTGVSHRRRTQHMTGQLRTTRSRAAAWVSLGSVAALLLTACGDDAPEEGAEPSPDQTADSAQDTETPEDETPDDEAADDEASEDETPDDGETSQDEGTADEDSESADPLDDAELPGEDTATFYSEDGAVAQVFGVEADDVLHIRQLPDPEAETLDNAAPTSELTLTGRERDVDSGIWAEVETDDGVGWVNTAYLAFFADEQDRTAEFSEVPPAEDAQTLAEGVAQRAVGEGEGSEHLEQMLVRPGEADGTGIWGIDVDGFRDDSVRGERWEVTIEQAEGGYEVTTVTSRTVCFRGAEDGLCL